MKLILFLLTSATKGQPISLCGEQPRKSFANYQFSMALLEKAGTNFDSSVSGSVRHRKQAYVTGACQYLEDFPLIWRLFLTRRNALFRFLSFSSSLSLPRDDAGHWGQRDETALPRVYGNLENGWPWSLNDLVGAGEVY